jgi:hypothetical protein
MKRITSRRELAIVVVVFAICVGTVTGATILTASAGGSYEAPSGLVVTTGTSHAVDDRNPFTSTDTLLLRNVTFSASGDASLTVDQFEGSTTNLSSIDASSTNITVDPGDKSAIEISGGVTAVDFEDARLDGSTQVTYSASGSGTITVTGLPADTQFAARSGGDVLTSGTTDGSGDAEIPVEAATDAQISLLEPAAPTIDNAEASPQNTELNVREVTFSAPVNDSDFADGADEVQAEFYLNGERFATKNITSNTTVSATTQLEQGGSNEWRIELTDQYDQTTSSETFSFEATAQLRVLNESAPKELVNSTTVEVTFFGSNTTAISESENGRINFTGLPLDEEFVADIQADGYRSRSVVIPSLLDQQEVYLLPEKTSSVQVRFELDDVTGTYSERSTVYIEKPITIDNETEYQIIVSDQFGVEGVTTFLEEGVRYELRIVSETGATAQLSKYDAEAAETVLLQPSAPAVERPEDGSVGYDISYSEDDEEVSIEYVDPAESTDELTVSIVSRDNETVLKPEQTYSGTNGLSLSVPTNGTLNETYYVNIEGTRNDASDTIDIREPIGPNRAQIDMRMPDGVWVQVIGAFAILLVGGVFSQLNRGVGAVVTSLFGGVLWFFGFMSGLASGGAVALAIGIATLNLFRPK